jgi:hypothetical protein
VKAFGELVRSEWQGLVAREGLAPPAHGAPATQEGSEEPRCPACGAEGPLVDGACADCGLQLA